MGFRWAPGLLQVFIIFVVLWEIDGRPQLMKPGCWHDGKRYQEGSLVNTTEPCLRCRCSDGSLRCRLRICPKLPNPAPTGCTTRSPRENACCAELICGDSHERNGTSKRQPMKSVRKQNDGCIHEGTWYAPGSAMMAYRRCEYCYCISGSRRCLRPRCLLPLAGCTPIYVLYSCCPVSYNCNKTDSALPILDSSLNEKAVNGCRVGNRSYNEGEMVRDIGWRATCENCFCAMGGVRCVPLACSPPLQGCTPIVREGHCCPSTYNCSGTIEVKAAQNFASYAFVSKDYAKFRKETHFYSVNPDSEEQNEEEMMRYELMGNSTVEGRGHKNDPPKSEIEESETRHKNLTLEGKKANSSAIVEKIEGKTNETEVEEKTSGPLLREEAIENEIPTESVEIVEKSSTIEVGKKLEKSSNATETTRGDGDSTTQEMEKKVDWTTETVAGSSTIEFTDSIVTSFANRDDSTENSLPTILETSTQASNEETTTDFSLSSDGEFSTTLYPIENATDAKPGNCEKNNSGNTSVEKGNEKFNESKTLGTEVSTAISAKGPASTGSPTTILMPDNIFVINVTLRTNVSVGHVQGVTMNPVRSMLPDIEAILNMTNGKKGEDYDYDYSQPTLPPSLPNVRIIPFVAADALVKEDEVELSSKENNRPLGGLGPSLSQELVATSVSTNNFYDIVTQKNLFSPPIETEGGFVPREPSYYDSRYRSTDRNLEIHTSPTTVPADITNSHRKNSELLGICVFENRNYHHGHLLPSSGHCILCICYYGEVACSDEKCPPLKIGCTRVENEKICCGKIICVDAEESPTVVLDRADPIAASPREPLPSIDGSASPDPFRDVIKTKPAPDLPSLIEDMIPYFVEHRGSPKISSPPPTSPMIMLSTVKSLATKNAEKFSSEMNSASELEIIDGEKLPIENSTKNVISGIEERLELTTNVISTSSDAVEVPGAFDEILGGGSFFFDHQDKGPEKLENPFELFFNEDKQKIQAEAVSTISDARDRLNETSNSKLLNNSKFFDSSLNSTSNLDSYSSSPKISSSPSQIEPMNVLQPPLSSGTEEPPERTSFAPSPISGVSGSQKTTIQSPGELQKNDLIYDAKKTLVSASADFEKSTKSTSESLVEAGSSTRTNLGTTSGDFIEASKLEESSTTSIFDFHGSITTDSVGTTDNEILTSANGLLKLAGCNIYGRMYRVGGIIAELSSQCLECRCTEVGVQCKDLEC